MYKTFEEYNNKNAMIKKVYYFRTSDLGELADNWVRDNNHNNGYAVNWTVMKPEKSGYPEIDNFLLSNGLKIGDEAILHSVW